MATEISLHKKTYQSSVSAKWESHENMENRSGPVGGDYSGTYSFHTAKELDPWLIIDLEHVYRSMQLRLFNRKGFEKRAKNIDIYVSEDFFSWTLVCSNSKKFGGVYDNNPLDIGIDNVRARFVRIQKRGMGALCLHQVACFVENAE